MQRWFRNTAVWTVLSFLALACSGNVDTGDGAGAGYDVPEGVLRIFADKEVIDADGVEKVTFTVIYGAEDVTDYALIAYSLDGVSVSLASPVFTSASAGEYVFTASYDYGGIIMTDNSVKVTVLPSEDVTLSGYFQKMVGMQFTSVGCVNCPALAETLKDVQRDYPGKVIPVAFHLDYDMADPMTLAINRKFYEKVSVKESELGVPMFAFNFRKGSQHIFSEYAAVVSEMQIQGKLYPAVCGVAVETLWHESERRLDVTARFRSDVRKDYRWHLLLVEDSYEYMQMGYEGTYVHDNVLRMMSSDNIQGSRLNQGEPLEPGKEYEVSRNFILPSGIVAANVKVIAVMLDSHDGGKTYGANNANVCPLGGSSDYAYVE